MTTRFNAVPLDLSRLPAPEAIKNVSYDAIMSERTDRLIALFAEAGVEFDTANLETDPAIILQQADAYREMLAKAAINDALRSVLVAFATGANLDHRAAGFGVTRMDGETDAALRRRVLFAPEAYGAAGSIGAYKYHALSADTRVKHADVWSPQAGHVEVAIQSTEGDGTADAALLSAVRARLLRDDIKPLTDAVAIRSVAVVPYSIAVRVQIKPGPAPQTVREAAEQSLAAMAAARNTPFRDVPRSAIYAAASVGGVDRAVIDQPTADIAMGRGETALCTSIAVEVEVIDV